MDNAPIFILGPTGCGKSGVAVALAALLGRAEIVSADAYQVYHAIPVLTAAPSIEERAGIAHHLIGNLSIQENNDAATHARRAQAAIADIQQRGGTPIVTGGSGLYVKFISHGISPAPPSDPHLRERLNALPLEESVRWFQEVDPEGAANTNLQNPRYVVRNLEIVLIGGKPLSHWRNSWTPESAGVGFHLVRETPELDTRIARRAHTMLEEGAIEEVAALTGQQLSATATRTLGLNLIQEYLAGKLTRSALAEALTLVTRQYAKRQRTWLRRELWTQPLMLKEKDTAAQVAQRIADKLL